MRRNLATSGALACLLALGSLPAAEPKGGKGAAWARHAIDDTSRGADGVRLADVNRDGRTDVVTGWEEGGLTRVYLNPGPARAREAWPAVTVGKSPSAEDAVFADLDGDGAVDVVSSCEGRANVVLVHWAPKDAKKYAAPAAWATEPLPVTQGMTSWMFALPMQVDGAGGIDLVVGSKGANAIVGWLRSPANPRKLADWTFHKLYSAGWVMSLIPADMDGDGRTDVIVSDRKGKNSGVLWLANPGPAKATGPWAEHRIGAGGREVMFAAVSDLDGDGRADVLAAVKPGEVHWFRHPGDVTKPWEARAIPVKLAAGVGTAKAIGAGDIDGDGKPDLVYTCEQAEGARRRVAQVRAVAGGRGVGRPRRQRAGRREVRPHRADRPGRGRRPGRADVRGAARRPGARGDLVREPSPHPGGAEGAVARGGGSRPTRRGRGGRS